MSFWKWLEMVNYKVKSGDGKNNTGKIGNIGPTQINEFVEHGMSRRNLWQLFTSI